MLTLLCFDEQLVLSVHYLCVKYRLTDEVLITPVSAFSAV